MVAYYYCVHYYIMSSDFFGCFCTFRKTQKYFVLEAIMNMTQYIVFLCPKFSETMTQSHSKKNLYVVAIFELFTTVIYFIVSVDPFQIFSY